MDSFDIQSTKKKVIKIKKRVKSIDEKVINNLYIPFLEKTFYLRKLNPNIPEIKQQISNSSKTNFEIIKNNILFKCKKLLFIIFLYLKKIFLIVFVG